MKYVRVRLSEKPVACSIELPASKSISNRLLIMNALSGNMIKISNLSDSDDTRVLQQAMQQLHTSENPEIDIHDAGTAARFLCAYLAMTGAECTLTGSVRMQNRPIAALVSALRDLGADIEYLQKDGFLPVRFNKADIKGNEIEIRADISSQFISALLLAGPYIKGGISLYLTGSIASWPYIEMTIKLMNRFGIICEWNDRVIKVPEGEYTGGVIEVERDWSSATPFYGICSIAGNMKIEFPNLMLSDLQGDSQAIDIFESMGVITSPGTNGLTICGGGPVKSFVEVDFTNCPDLAQTVMTTSACNYTEAFFTGLQTLHYKETNRFGAMIAELNSLGVSTRDDAISTIKINPAFSFKPSIIKTYSDHRMAMAFVVFALRIGSIVIENPDIVSKSFPGFWKQIERAGLSVEFF
jgi:3-phosphoshikimate 1-carboxyvinyltransferase